MKAEVKAKWLEALRSGEYRQARRILRGSSGTFCCLGVLCEIQGAVWGTGDVDMRDHPDDRLNPWASYPPDNLRAGLTVEECGKLAKLNDGDADCFGEKRAPMDFDQIAAYIDAHIPSETSD